MNAILKPDQSLIKVYEHLDRLVVAEIATTAAQITNQVGQLKASTEAIWQKIRLLCESPLEPRHLDHGMYDYPRTTSIISFADCVERRDGK